MSGLKKKRKDKGWYYPNQAVLYCMFWHGIEREREDNLYILVERYVKIPV